MRSVEIFSGAGGLALGLRLAGFSHELLLERDADACTTLRNNAGEWRLTRSAAVVQADIKSANLRPYRGVALLAGGAACQPFSIGGVHKGHADARNLLPHFIEAVETLRPPAFVLENVDGLLRPAFADYFDYVLQRLRRPSLYREKRETWRAHRIRLRASIEPGLHYQVTHARLNAADFGVPQIRRRVFVVGVRSDFGATFQFPKGRHSSDRLLYDQWVTGDYWKRHRLSMPETVPSHFARRISELRSKPPVGRPWRTVRDAFIDLPKPSLTESPAFPQHILRSGARVYTGHTGSDLDWPSKTLKAGDHGVPGGENMVRLDDQSVRYFTIRELARLQTFPDTWQFAGAWNSVTRQIGNAVPVALGLAIGKPVLDLLGRVEDCRNAQ